MKVVVIGFIVLIFALLLCFILANVERHEAVISEHNATPRESRASPPAAGVIPANSVFHKPIGVDCPAGTTFLPAYFKERDGTPVDACWNPKGDGSIDYLNPGESCCFDFRVKVHLNDAH